MTRPEPSFAPASVTDAAPPGAALPLRVTAIRWEAPTVRSVELRDPAGARLPPLDAGAHLDLALPGDLSRSYSRIDGPGLRDRYTVAVHRDPASRGGSAWLCEALRVGEVLPVTLPRNTFPLAATDGPSHFLAGGIGITPILGMIRHLDAAGRPWRLTYAVRSRGAAAFLADLEALDAGRGLVAVHADDEAGRVLPVADVVAAAPAAAHLYACGPAPLLDAFRAATRDRDEDRVHTERFSAAPAPAAERGFTVALRRRGIEVAVAPGQSILDALQGAGVRVAHSCREGVCGTCETRVVEGEPEHRDNVLSPRERASGKVMMICCSGCRGDRLVLDL